jgi:hypothetical protein
MLPKMLGDGCEGSHRVQVMVHETWLGEYLYSDPLSHESNLTATAIAIYGAYLLHCNAGEHF